MSIGQPRTWRSLWLSLWLGPLLFSGFATAQPVSPYPLAVAAKDDGAAAVKPGESRMWMTVGERRFAVTLADNAAARALAAQLPLTLDMPDLNGNEKHAKLPKALPANASKPRTIRTGDLMLYGSDTLVVFSLKFDSPYSYSRLGQVDDAAGLAQALSPGSARIVLSQR